MKTKLWMNPDIDLWVQLTCSLKWEQKGRKWLIALNFRAYSLSTSVVTVFVWDAGVNYRVLCWLYGLADWELKKDNNL